jgi:hypothetical protein
MFTVLSKSRDSSLFLICGLVVGLVVLLTFSLVPAISFSKPALIPVTGASEAQSDYFLRHPGISLSTENVNTLNSDFYQRHPAWMVNAQNAVAPMIGSLELSDYAQRHPELSVSAGIVIDTADYFLRHLELRPSAPSTDLSDYFLRH